MKKCHRGPSIAKATWAGSRQPGKVLRIFNAPDGVLAPPKREGRLWGLIPYRCGDRILRTGRSAALARLSSLVDCFRVRRQNEIAVRRTLRVPTTHMSSRPTERK